MNNITEYNNIDENKYNGTINNKNNSKYKCAYFCPLAHNNIVSSIDIFNDYLVYGTFMGEVYLCFLNEFSKNTLDYADDSNRTYVNNTIDNEIIDNERENKIKEIKLKTNKLKKGNKIQKKNIKIYVNKELDSQELQHDENICSYNSSNKIKFNKYYDKNENIYIKKLYQANIENISCVSLYDDILNFSVGDNQLIHCEKISSYRGNDLRKAYNFKIIDNYTSNKEHNEFCETAQCFLSKNNYLIIYFFYYDFSWPLRFNQVKYENKNLSNFEVIKGYIYMSNFNVPFDFDGDKFLYLEHYSKTLRCINVYSTLKEQKIFVLNINNEFEHISHMKLLPNDCIFLCRKIFYCEIYKYKNNAISKKEDINENNKNKHKDFILLKEWIHKYNKEIISSNVYIKENIIIEDNNKQILYKSIKDKKENRNKIKLNLKLLESDNSLDNYSESKNKINYKNNNLNFGDSDDDNCYGKEIIRIKTEKGRNENININSSRKNNNNILINEEKENIYIITLDEDGNFNLFYHNPQKDNEIITTLFNLYDIQNIEQKYKDVKFFSRGYPYYITMNDFYYVITFDDGIFVINSEKE